MGQPLVGVRGYEARDSLGGGVWRVEDCYIDMLSVHTRNNTASPNFQTPWIRVGH